MVEFYREINAALSWDGDRLEADSECIACGWTEDVLMAGLR